VLSVVISISPLEIANFQEFRNIAFVAYAEMSEPDLESFGNVLEQYHFQQIPNEEFRDADSEGLSEKKVSDETTQA